MNGLIPIWVVWTVKLTIKKEFLVYTQKLIGLRFEFARLLSGLSLRLTSTLSPFSFEFGRTGQFRKNANQIRF